MSMSGLSIRQAACDAVADRLNLCVGVGVVVSISKNKCKRHACFDMPLACPGADQHRHYPPMQNLHHLAGLCHRCVRDDKAAVRKTSLQLLSPGMA